MPSDAPDFGSAVRFVNALIKSGIAIHRATAAVHGGRQAVSRQLARREDGAGVPSARDGHVRAAGSPGRHRVSGRHADAAVRRGRLDAGDADGRAVRSHPRRIRRPVREADGLRQAARGHDPRRAAGRRLLLQPQVERQLHRDQPAARGQRRGDVARGRPDGRRHVLRGEQADDSRDSAEGGDRPRRQLRERGHGAGGPASKLRKLRVGLFDTYSRRHAGRLDAAAARELRVPVRGGLSADARRRQPQGEVRRARLQRRRSQCRRWWRTWRRRWRRWRCAAGRR